MERRQNRGLGLTRIDRSVSGGISIQGRLWKRPTDNIGVAAARNYLSGDDRFAGVDHGSLLRVACPARAAPRDTLRLMPLRIMVSRHSVFYSPLIATIAGGFLERHGMAAEYAILAAGQRSSALIGAGAVDIMQSAVSSNWKPMEQGESPLPVHFA
ncbi:MAG: hypothetical protein ABSH45_11245, partial [Bryobacteraceae bacterium]